MLDTAYRIATPEGIELSLRLAGPVPRALAWLIDFAWRAGVVMVFATLIGVLAGNSKLMGGLLLILLFLIEWVVPAWLEAVWDGATPGKRALGIRVLRDDGSPLTFGPAFVRNILRTADFLPGFYSGGLICSLLHPQFKRLGDLVAGTIVVYVDPPEKPPVLVDVETLAPSIPITLGEKRAILDYAERVPQLSEERADELAQIVAPILLPPQRQGAAARLGLVGVAQHLMGARHDETR
ncbi:RDD family protein [Ahniella affigens]|nr:RDD family protein [Ahniella affigens]